jgi:hypothetical protein
MKPLNLAGGVLSALAGSTACLLCVAAIGAEPPAKQDSHPLDPVILWAEGAFQRAEKIKDYTALLTKRERIGDRLEEHQFLQLKIRHEPFSVYIKFLRRGCERSREILYVEGQNDGMLLAHDAGGMGTVLGTVKLAPDGLIAMRGQRYPVTMIGFKNLGLKLLEQAKRDRQIEAPTDVKWFNGAKVNGQIARCVQVTHPVRHPEHQFAVARVYVDEELGIPIRYEGYAWPENPDGKPVLVEEYTYSCIQLNLGLSDADFDVKNPRYNFQ